VQRNGWAQRTRGCFTAAVLALGVSCSGPLHYDGTYQGTVVSTLSPAPAIYGSPTYVATLVLTEGSKLTAVDGTLDAGTTYAAQQQVMTGTFSGTVTSKDALNPLTVTVDQLFQDCAINLTLTGSGTLTPDPKSNIPTLAWNAQGQGLCAGTQTQVTLVAAGMPQIDGGN
jgi:hypothetical protein